MSGMESKLGYDKSIASHDEISLENLFNLKFTAKQLEKQSKRCQKDEVQEKAKLKKVINYPKRLPGNMQISTHDCIGHSTRKQ
jgi:hypothetical protein